MITTVFQYIDNLEETFYIGVNPLWLWGVLACAERLMSHVSSKYCAALCVVLCSGGSRGCVIWHSAREYFQIEHTTK